MLVVPMVSRSVGGRDRPVQAGQQPVSNDELQTMTIFAGYAAQAIANATAYGQLERSRPSLARQLQSQRQPARDQRSLLSPSPPGRVWTPSPMACWCGRLRQPVGLPLRSRPRGPGAGPHTQLHAEEVARLPGAVRPRLMGGQWATASRPGNDALTIAVDADPGHAGRSGGAHHRAARGRRGGHRLHNLVAGSAAQTCTSARRL